MQRQVLKEKPESAERSAFTVATNENVKMEAIYLHVLERNQICLAGEALELFLYTPKAKITADTIALTEMASLK